MFLPESSLLTHLKKNSHRKHDQALLDRSHTHGVPFITPPPSRRPYQYSTSVGAPGPRGRDGCVSTAVVRTITPPREMRGG